MYYISGTKNTHSIINSVPVWSGYPQYFKIGTVRVIMFFSSVFGIIWVFRFRPPYLGLGKINRNQKLNRPKPKLSDPKPN